MAAASGRRVLVITIDPARRLATSLGLKESGNDIVEVQGAVPAGCTGSLHALMLDARTTFDELIMRISPDRQVHQRILSNRIYRLLSESIAGSHNVMATEKLYEIMQSAEWDLVVLDTPPTSNALDFLESSGYLARFLDDKVMGWFLGDRRGKKSLRTRLLAPAQNVAIRLLAAIFGRRFLDDLLDFFEAFGGLYQGFRERSEAIRAILKSSNTTFAVVCMPRALSLRETRRLADQLIDQGHPVGAWFINQCSPYPGRVPGADGNLLAAGDQRRIRELLRLSGYGDQQDAVVEALEAAYRRSAAQSDRDAALLQSDGPDPKRVLVHTLPLLDTEVVELDSLKRFAELFRTELAASEDTG